MVFLWTTFWWVEHSFLSINKYATNRLNFIRNKFFSSSNFDFTITAFHCVSLHELFLSSVSAKFPMANLIKISVREYSLCSTRKKEKETSGNLRLLTSSCLENNVFLIAFLWQASKISRVQDTDLSGRNQLSTLIKSLHQVQKISLVLLWLNIYLGATQNASM